MAFQYIRSLSQHLIRIFIPLRSLYFIFSKPASFSFQFSPCFQYLPAFMTSQRPNHDQSHHHSQHYYQTHLHHQHQNRHHHHYFHQNSHFNERHRRILHLQTSGFAFVCSIRADLIYQIHIPVSCHALSSRFFISSFHKI